MKRIIFLAILVLIFFNPIYGQVILTPDGQKMQVLQDTTQLSSFIDSLYLINSFSGIVAICKNAEIIYEHSKGYANKENQTIINTSTLFNLASMNKMFTGVAIAQLVEKNMLSLSDRVIKFFPEYSDKNWAGKATIENLLTHTSGLGEFIPFQHKIKSLFNLSEIVDTISETVSKKDPGNEMVYSNAGFYFLGRIIEIITGENYFEYIKQNIFIPAGMNNTFFEVNDDQQYATGYMYDEIANSIVPNTKVVKKKGGPAGGAYSNVKDIIAFQKALMDGKLISKKSLELITVMKVKGKMPGLGYGLGIGVGVIPNGMKWVGHNGGAPGIATDYSWFIESGYSVIILMNQDAQSNLPIMMNVKFMVSNFK